MSDSMIKTREFLQQIGLPGGDDYSLPSSQNRFPDNAQYRFEVPGIQSPGTMQALLEELDSYKICIHRVTQQRGLCR